MITNGGSGPIEITFSDPFWLETGYTHCYDTLTVTDATSGQSWDLCGEEVSDNDDDDTIMTMCDTDH